MEAATEHSATIDNFFKPVSDDIIVSKESSSKNSGNQDGETSNILETRDDSQKDTQATLKNKLKPEIKSKKKKNKRKRQSVDNSVPKKTKYTKSLEESNIIDDDCGIVDEPEAMSFDEFMNKNSHQTQLQDNLKIRKCVNSRTKNNLLSKREKRKTLQLRKKPTSVSCSAVNSKRKNSSNNKSEARQPRSDVKSIEKKNVESRRKKKIPTKSKHAMSKKGESKVN